MLMVLSFLELQRHGEAWGTNVSVLLPEVKPAEYMCTLGLVISVVSGSASPVNIETTRDIEGLINATDCVHNKATCMTLKTSPPG